MKIRLAEIMKERNLTDRQLSEMTGVSKSQINGIRRGIHEPSFQSLEKLAEGLNLKISDIVYSKYL